MLRYNLVVTGDQENLTAFIDGEMYVASNTHPNWTTIKRMVVVDRDESVVDQFDVGETIINRFRRLSTNVAIENDEVTLDGDPLDDSLTKKIKELVESGSDDWRPFVNFLDKVQANPSENSKTQLYTFLAAHQYDILPDGNILGYKGVNRDGDEYFKSIHSGTASVNDVVQTNQQIRQAVGDTVTMPRSAVTDDPNQSCSYGLHIASFDYAKSYGHVVMAVSVNPRDVVSVPYGEAYKVRACRYTNLGLTTEPGTWDGKYEDGDDEDEEDYDVEIPDFADKW